MLLADADGDGVQSGGQVYTPVVSAAKACVALWMALERCLVRICIRPLDKSQGFLYLLDRQWLTVDSRFSRWVLMLQNQRCLGFYTEPYIHWLSVLKDEGRL